MLWRYPAKYRDKSGEESTTIENDGRELRMIVRGIEFRGTDFDSFESSSSVEATKLAQFTTCHGELCSCEIDCEIPMLLVGFDATNGILLVHLELGDPDPKGWPDREFLQLELRTGVRMIQSRGLSGWFEDEMLDIQKQLPEGAFMKSCINCAFSDYFPAGHGLFGDMMCFRNNKEGYRSVNSKAELFQIGGQTKVEQVQETYLCPEFERRKPGTGYRG